MRLLGRAQAASYGTRRGITASAAKINLRDRTEVQERANTYARSSPWQTRAWDHYDGIGEIKFAYNLVAAVMSRIRLYPAYVVNPEEAPVALTDAVTIERPEGEEAGPAQKGNAGVPAAAAIEARDLYRKALGKSSIPTIMRSFALNISVPGECHLALLSGRWEVKSTEELRVDGSGPKLYKTRGAMPQELDPSTPIGRIWREHPRHSYEPDSAMMALADDCDELLLLSRVIRVNGRARLNAGLLFLPDELAVLARTVSDELELEEEEEDALEKELMAAIQASVQDEDSMATVHPTVIRGPAEAGKAIAHITLDRKIDEFLVQRADRTLERILQGLDVPKDIVTGLANVKYSNAVQIDESLYKAHVEPLALMVCDAFTEIVLQPLLRAAWSDDEDLAEHIDRFVVWYDPSEVVTRPDRAADAKSLYDVNELSGSALRQAYGYSDIDRPSEEETARRLALANTPPPEVLMLLIQQVLPNALKSLSKSGGASDTLPDELEQMLSGGETPADFPLEPTAVTPPEE